MRSRVLLAALGAALIATNAHAQTTADGVVALARGEEAVAAQILRPIAEDWRRDDRAAQFFLGTMYETGRGVPLDPLRACALYQMATFSNEGIFTQPAFRLIKKLLRDHGNAWYEECGVLANIGLGHRFETTSFTLSSGESVEWTLAGATVTYQQQARRFPIRAASRGAIFLPLRRTELRVSGGGPAPRHLVQLLFWQPSPSGTTWSLQWFLYEIAQGNLGPAGFETALKQFEGHQPPDLSMIDLDALVDLHVNEQGVAVATLQTQAGPRVVELPKR